MSNQIAEEAEIDGDLAAKMAVVEQQWPHTVDAQVWAEKWMEHMETSPTIAHDKGTMLGWFANAIMAGYDTAQMRAGQSAREVNDQEIRIFLDGDKWCALRGEDLQIGTSCFGDTPMQALAGWMELYGPEGSALKERDEKRRIGEEMDGRALCRYDKAQALAGLQGN